MATVFNEFHHPSINLKKLVLLGSPNSLEVIMKDYKKLAGFNSKVYDGLDKLLKKLFGYHIADFNVEDFAVNITAQTLILHDKSDLIVPFAAGNDIAQKIQQATFIESKTGGHSLNTEENTNRIINFLRS